MTNSLNPRIPNPEPSQLATIHTESFSYFVIYGMIDSASPFLAHAARGRIFVMPGTKSSPFP